MKTMYVRRLVLAFAFFAACGLPAAAQTPIPGGTLKIALRGDPATLDCHAISSSHVAFALFPAYSTLLKFDAANYPAIVGDLAQSWTVSKDGLVYTFKLHPGIKFHDGTPLTAVDVKATYERLRNPPPGVLSLRRDLFAAIKTIEVVDPLTIRFTLSPANPAMLTVFANPWNCVYSAARLAQDPKFPSKEVMGSGPFKMVERSPGNRIVYEKFDDYFRPGLPYLQRLELIVLSNAGVVPALSSGQVDADFFTFSAPLQAQITKARGAKTVFDTSETTTAAIVTFNTKRAPFGDVRVRRALTMAIDRAAADANLPKLIAVKGTSPIYRTGTEYALSPQQLAGLPGYGADIERARAEARGLLKEAGVPNLKLSLLLPNTRDPYEPYGVFLADSWRRIGVTVELHAVDSGAYQAAKTGHDFDAVLEWNSSQSLHPIEVLDKFVPGTPGNFGGGRDEELLTLYGRIKQETDPAQLRMLTQKFVIREVEQAWSAPLLWATRTMAIPATLRGWKTPPSFTLGLDHAGLWWDKPPSQ
jgi:peptide/nickel transport system substrate-binding protein